MLIPSATRCLGFDCKYFFDTSKEVHSRSSLLYSPDAFSGTFSLAAQYQEITLPAPPHQVRGRLQGGLMATPVSRHRWACHHLIHSM